ncbi:SHC SH2 domain-binding protein 1 [Leptonychotes weddellii]|uniref:SHC SH2 domain-binding protein 1 n=1 Tax=Leptonychotes weddellii TaxID=9713 RepID=A0A2U3XE46_LEPWE|nr:SHC SH2 domain-binding protein 1 [Leptonychotes weddellii]
MVAEDAPAFGPDGCSSSCSRPQTTLSWADRRVRSLFQDEDSCSDCSNHDKPGSSLPSFVPSGKTHFPEIFQTSQLLFYERFKAYQDYILADCKASEVREFTAEFLEKVLEPSGWRAVWHTNVFEVLVEVTDVDFAALKAAVRLADPYLCESQVSSFTLECMNELLNLKEHRLPLQELWVVFDDSGVFDQTALAIEHVRFFYQNIWRSWDEEEEDEYDYFVRCVEPRLRLGYGLPDDIVIEKRGKGDTFVDCTGVDIKISGIKFIQHDAVEGILIIHRGKTTLENCVLQCETTGVTVRTSAEFLMKNSDLYGAKGAGIEIYPGSKCTLSDNEIHHCKEGILIKDFLDEHYDIPKISMVNNVIHNNEGYGVVLVKPTIFSDLQENVQDEIEENRALKIPTSEEAGTAERVDLEELIQCATGKMELYARSSLSEQAEGNCEIVNELVAASTQKGQMKKKRLSELGITQADDNLMSQEMFVSIVGNQFKWNGKGSFGTFLF